MSRGNRTAGRHTGSKRSPGTFKEGVRYETTGWRPSCDHDVPHASRQRVLDPFAGSGTVGLVADRLQRDAVLIEISPEYAQMARDRITDDGPLLAEVL